MFCLICGNQVNENARFCPSCGNHVQARQMVRPADVAPVTPRVYAAPGGGAAAQGAAATRRAAAHSPVGTDEKIVANMKHFFDSTANCAIAAASITLIVCFFIPVVEVSTLFLSGSCSLYEAACNGIGDTGVYALLLLVPIVILALGMMIGESQMWNLAYIIEGVCFLIYFMNAYSEMVDYGLEDCLAFGFTLYVLASLALVVSAALAYLHSRPVAEHAA